MIEIVKLGIFVVFGSLLTLHGLFADGLSAVALVAVALLLARPLAVWAALAGQHVDRATKAITALVALCSILAHGLTDTPGSEWIARRRGDDNPRAIP